MHGAMYAYAKAASYTSPEAITRSDLMPRCRPFTGLQLSIDAPNRRFQFQKRRQLFIRTHNEPFSVAAMCVSNPDCSPSNPSRLRPAHAESGFDYLVNDDLLSTSLGGRCLLVERE